MDWDLDFPGLACQRRWYAASRVIAARLGLSVLGSARFSIPTGRFRAAVRGCIEVEVDLLLVLLLILALFIARMVNEVPTDDANVQNVPSRDLDFRSNQRCQARKLEIDMSKL
ncbi:hypothetical protein PIB30_023866 [Stylosanthes scabra]|uniref:Uncharacterized protein n=1 Tax=Stylosanthes scabra TaxID=79078 RepID=A0ABU6SB20_9FABA|nr:hypothetical protein [Stylosanthes scabra]